MTPVNDIPYNVAMDSSWNAYIKGQSYGSGTNNDYATVKYSADPTTQIANLICKVENLINTGVLNKGQGNSLIRKLEEARKLINKGNNTAACNKLKDFIDEVNAFIRSGKLASEEGLSLIDVANIIMTRICE